jgi:hypothetical protein
MTGTEAKKKDSEGIEDFSTHGLGQHPRDESGSESRERQADGSLSSFGDSANIPASGISVPISVFSAELGSFETITRYLKEICGLRNHDIAGFTGRHEKTTWGACSRSLGKRAEPLAGDSGSYSGIKVPLSAIRDRELGVLESLSLYLKETLNLRYCQIARLLHRDQRTIWTAVSRARKKIGRRQTQ